MEKSKWVLIEYFLRGVLLLIFALFLFYKIGNYYDIITSLILLFSFFIDLIKLKDLQKGRYSLKASYLFWGAIILIMFYRYDVTFHFWSPLVLGLSIKLLTFLLFIVKYKVIGQTRTYLSLFWIFGLVLCYSEMLLNTTFYFNGFLKNISFLSALELVVIFLFQKEFKFFIPSVFHLKRNQ